MTGKEVGFNYKIDMTPNGILGTFIKFKSVTIKARGRGVTGKYTMIQLLFILCKCRILFLSFTHIAQISNKSLIYLWCKYYLEHYRIK